MNEKRFTIDFQRLVRMLITLGTIVGAYYIDREKTEDEIAENKSQISMLERSCDSHSKTARVYTLDELTDKFITRREYESAQSALREDMKYLRDKIDLIFDKVSKAK